MSSPQCGPTLWPPPVAHPPPRPRRPARPTPAASGCAASGTCSTTSARSPATPSPSATRPSTSSPTPHQPSAAPSSCSKPPSRSPWRRHQAARIGGKLPAQQGFTHPSPRNFGLNNLANVLADQGDLDRARTLHERALHIREARLGPDHADTARSRERLAEVVTALENCQ